MRFGRHSVPLMLRPVHMAEGHIHHLFDNGDGILRGLLKTKPYDRIEAPRVALVADVVPVYAARFAVLFLMAYRALHEFVSFETMVTRCQMHMLAGFQVLVLREVSCFFLFECFRR